MVVNPAGFQVVTDFGAPSILGGRARATITAGQLVTLSGASASPISSGLNSFDPTTDMLFSVTAVSGLDFVGIALADAGSNESLAVATKGCFIVTAAGTIVAGRTILSNGGDAVVAGTTAGAVIGRSLTSAGSEGYVLAQIGRS